MRCLRFRAVGKREYAREIMHQDSYPNKKMFGLAKQSAEKVPSHVV